MYFHATDRHCIVDCTRLLQQLGELLLVHSDIGRHLILQGSTNVKKKMWRCQQHIHPAVIWILSSKMHA